MPHITVHQALAFFQAHDLSIQLVSLMLFNLSVELVSLMVQEFESWWGQGKQLIVVCNECLLFQTGVK
jgi:hypothetical protein